LASSIFALGGVSSCPLVMLAAPLHTCLSLRSACAVIFAEATDTVLSVLTD
jgi:hypothetical protein